TFAADPRHFALDAPETLHDAWLVELAVREPAAGARRERRATEIELRFLGAFHDRHHVLHPSTEIDVQTVALADLHGRLVRRGWRRFARRGSCCAPTNRMTGRYFSRWFKIRG